MKHTNDLIYESSPYLLQHAHNPVQWNAWKDSVLKSAQGQNRLLVISIGYAACHWCHVMEHECFEDEEVADVMNAHFVSIKIDREERPDLDQIYMDALQIMTGRGGWPLNVIALPDGRPIWGATYVPKEQWISALLQLTKLYQQDPEKINTYAEDLTQAIHKINAVPDLTAKELPGKSENLNWISQWKSKFDPNNGGNLGAPKFMMPVNYTYLGAFNFYYPDSTIKNHLNLSLQKMAYGGVYDQLGGGFARYSVDDRWHVPHFEKMLYDNGQLLGLYAENHGQTGKALYAEICEGIYNFTETELKCPSGGYYASLDADSLDSSGNLEEGAYYIWEENELKDLLGSDFNLFREFFNINATGHWEGGKYVLIRTRSTSQLAKDLNLKEEDLSQKISELKYKLQAHQKQRPNPRLDDKIITSWNSLYLSGLSAAYRYLQVEKYRLRALELGTFIADQLMDAEGRLVHTYKNNTQGPNGYLEDYACTIKGFIDLYEISALKKWLDIALKLCRYTLTHFASKDHPFFYFTSGLDTPLVRRTIDNSDNVIPASNSLMGENLFRLGHYFYEKDFIKRVEDMLSAMKEPMIKFPAQHNNWFRLSLLFCNPFYEVAVIGSDSEKFGSELLREYLPNAIFAFGNEPEKLPTLAHHPITEETLIYICSWGACEKPQKEVEKAIKILKTTTS